MAVKAPQVRKKPTIACVGRVSEIKEAKVTGQKFFDNGEKKPRYLMQTLALEPWEEGEKARVNILLRPEWLEDGFDPDKLVQYNNAVNSVGDTLLNVFRNNVVAAEDEAPATLVGLCGCNTDLWIELTNRLTALVEASRNPETNAVDSAKFLEGMPALFEQFFMVDFKDKIEIGYVLKQQMQGTGQTGDNGREIKVPTRYYEIGEFFDARDEKTYQRFQKRAGKDEHFEIRYTISGSGTPF